MSDRNRFTQFALSRAYNAGARAALILIEELSNGEANPATLKNFSPAVQAGIRQEALFKQAIYRERDHGAQIISETGQAVRAAAVIIRRVEAKGRATRADIREIRAALGI